ncbi:MAG TPA: tRNA (adenosine(37)-N6)-threonylcarbamoyltransferase complex dimerization subunit type 1 TsaB [Aliidongia sp.]|nr:tRNA (adenosine(37)-N6)-threonylcarbamoyltransferase complex dimerization subunit type 1 TsaB [Aliidongia sp.]
MSEPVLHRILAFDCSGGACSAAVWSDGAIRAERMAVMERGHAEALMPQIRDVMAEAGLDFTALDALATTVGPGSFTGLRLGLAAAKGLALATDLPIMAFSGFEAVLAGIPAERRSGRPVAVAIDSRRGPVFAQLFTAEGRAAAPPEAVEPNNFEAWLPPGPILVSGDGTPGLAAPARADIEISAVPSRISAAALARQAASLGRAGLGRLPVAPLYLRPPDVTLPKQAAS